MDIAFFQPDQPLNVGTMVRLGACMGTPVHVIEPCGFPFSVRAVKRSALDYADLIDITRHMDFAAFQDWRKGARRRLVLLTTKSALPYSDFAFEPHDVLMVGSESTGVPADVHECADARVTIPMVPGARSINVAVALSMVLGEALRQTGSWPKDKI